MQRLMMRLTIILLAVFSLHGVPARAQEYVISYTDIVLEVDTATIDVYGSASMGGGALYPIVRGNRILWNGKAVRGADGRNWLQVYLVDRRESGWISPDNATLYQTDTFRVTPGMEVGATAQLAQPAELYGTARLRRTGSADAGHVIGSLPAGSSVTVTDGPVFNQLQTFWKVKNSTGLEGWIIDAPASLTVTAPLTVYGVQVCDHFNIRRFGVAGWDSFMQVIRNFVPANETITCLASSNLRGNGSPVVTVLTSKTTAEVLTQDTIRVFALNGGQWAKVLEIPGQVGDRTERLGAYDVTGDGIPRLVWLTRTDGTGGILNINIYGFTSGAGQLIFNLSGLYKGNLQLGVGNIVFFQPILGANEPNCCPTGYNRIAYQWQNGQFVKTLDDQPLSPYAVQGAPGQPPGNG
jgi:hypothetical protein